MSYPNSKQNKFLRSFALCLTLVLSSLASIPFASAQESPKPVIENMVSSILSILRDESLTPEENKIAVRAELFKSFDSRAMAQSVLSSNWRKASTEQQTEFEALFLQTLENTYIDRLEAYTDEEVKFLDEEIKNNRATVDTVIVTSSNDIPVDYKLRLRSDGWFVYDVVVENVSMVSSYRDTYRSIVRRSGMDDLLAQMRDKNAELEQ